MTTKPRQPRPVSFYLAAGAAIICVVAVGFILARALTAPPSTNRAGDDQAFKSGGPIDVLGRQDGAVGLHIQIMDRDDRSRIAAELRSATFDPLQAHRYRVTKPRATMYLDDGRVVHIASNGGTLVMPDRAKAPETGTLTDSVVVRLFDPPADGDRLDIQSDEPVFTWRGASLTFDSTLGEASTNEPFVLTSPDFEFRADDAKLLINQTLERLERFNVRGGGTLVYFDRPEEEPTNDNARANDPSKPDDRTATKNQSAEPRADGPTQSPKPGPVVTFYQAAMRDGVVLDRDGQRVESDRLDFFARTIDNKLPPNAIARFGTAAATGSPNRSSISDASPRTTSEDATGNPIQVTQAAPTADAAEGVETDSGNATLTWTGVLEVRPLTTQPPELDGNHLLARFTAEQSGIVTFSDAGSEASGQAAMVEYSFTTQSLVLSGPSQESSVFITSPSMGRATMGRFELSLATADSEGTVDAVIPGPFSVVGADGISSIDARQRTTLTFAVRDGRLTGELLEAAFLGSARAADADATLKADLIHAYFEPDTDQKSRLVRLIASENVTLEDGKGAGGRCDALDTKFAANTDSPVPESFTADGNVSFRDKSGKIDSSHLYVMLRESESGAIEVVKAWADGDVVFLQFTDQIEITGQRLFADTDAQFIEVEHEDGQARVARGATVIAGEMVRLNGSLRTALVEGPGMFGHRAGRGDQASHVLANWQEGMAFDDATGQLECLGGVEALHEPDSLTRETISAQLVRVELDPADGPPDATESGDVVEPTGDSDRAIRTVYAAGSAYFGTGDQLATIESARYAHPLLEAGTASDETEPAQVLERAFRLSGVEIISDNLAGTLDVPGRGRLFVADLRPDPEGEDASADRGAALFDWLGSLHADRALGTAEMLEGVQMSHTNAADASKTLLESARLRINFAPAEGEGSLFGGLRSAIADTNVYLRTTTRELTADLLEYNPDTGIARALAGGIGDVQILDRASGSPMSASAIIWNLTTDRVDIVDPSTITIPR